MAHMPEQLPQVIVFATASRPTALVQRDLLLHPSLNSHPQFRESLDPPLEGLHEIAAAMLATPAEADAHDSGSNGSQHTQVRTCLWSLGYPFFYLATIS